MLCQFFFAWSNILREKNLCFGKHLFAKQRLITCKLRVEGFATGRNFSFNQCLQQESFCFFSRKNYFIKAKENCVCISWCKHSRGWENSRQLWKPETNPCRVYIRLCKHGKRFLLLVRIKPTCISNNLKRSLVHFISLPSRKSKFPPVAESPNELDFTTAYRRIGGYAFRFCPPFFTCSVLAVLLFMRDLSASTNPD